MILRSHSGQFCDIFNICLVRYTKSIGDDQIYFWFNSVVAQHFWFFLSGFSNNLASYFINISCRPLLELLNMSQQQQDLFFKDLLVMICHPYQNRLSDTELKSSLMLWRVKCCRGQYLGDCLKTVNFNNAPKAKLLM